MLRCGSYDGGEVQGREGGGCDGVWLGRRGGGGSVGGGSEASEVLEEGTWQMTRVKEVNEGTKGNW